MPASRHRGSGERRLRHDDPGRQRSSHSSSTPTAIEAPAGEDFCIEFTNNDDVPHDIGIDETDFNGEDVQPGETITYRRSRRWRPATTPSTAPFIRR